MFWRGVSAIAILFLFIFGCSKIKSTEIGDELIPAVDNITTFDTTLEVITENFGFTDSAAARLLPTVNGGAPELIAGHISNDPQFGKSTGSLFLYYTPTFFPFPYEVKDSLYIDSVVLCLRWTGNTYGDTNQVQKFDVYQLDEKLRADTVYTTNDAIPYSRFLGSRSFAPAELNDSLTVLEQKLTNQLRIRLNDEFGEELLKLDTAAGQPLHRDTLLRNYIRGFAVVPDEAGASMANALMGFAISDTNSYLRIYYRYDSLGKQDTTFKTWGYAITSGFANHIKRDYQGTEIASTLGSGEDSIAYIQTTPGTYTRITIPDLNTFRALKGNVLIHKAELAMQQVPSTGQGDDIFVTPDLLYMDFRDSSTNAQRPFLFDGFLQGAYQPAVIGGRRKIVSGPTGTAISEYCFNIPRHVQGIITRNDPNSPFFLYSPYAIRYTSPLILTPLNPLAKGRVKLGGGSKTTQKMVLRIIYSKI